MNFAFLSLLRISRAILLLLFCSSVVFTLMLVGGCLQELLPTSGQPTPAIRLQLDLRHPHLIYPFQAAAAGFEDGLRGTRRTEPFCLPPYQDNAAGFEMRDQPEQRVLRYREPAAAKRLLLLLLGVSHEYLSLAFTLFLGGATWLLWKIVRDVSLSTPFTMANARRLRWLALLILGLNLWQELVHGLVLWLVPAFHAATVGFPLNHYILLNNETEFPGVLVGIILAIIATVYQRGVVLAQEAELTV